MVSRSLILLLLNMIIWYANDNESGQNYIFGKILLLIAPPIFYGYVGLTYTHMHQR